MLNAWVYFNLNDLYCKTQIISKLPYKDPITQNDIYETQNFAYCTKNLENKNDWKKVDLTDILTEGQILTVKLEFKQTESSQNIKIPLDFVINKIS